VPKNKDHFTGAFKVQKEIFISTGILASLNPLSCFVTANQIVNLPSLFSRGRSASFSVV
jgi:hypothetical protein